MTFNIRYGTANDGENHWDKRKDFLVDVIRAEAPHVLGVQEALHGQLAYILEALPDYAMVGVGRDDGIRKGEYSSILYRRASLSLSRSDTFWFSETPGACRFHVMGQHDHAHLHVGAVHGARRPAVLRLQPAPRSPVAAVTREVGGAAPHANRGARPEGAGDRHRRLQRRREEPGGDGDARRQRPARHVQGRSTRTHHQSARSPASSSARCRARRSTTSSSRRSGRWSTRRSSARRAAIGIRRIISRSRQR